jgi:hypothetical protein
MHTDTRALSPSHSHIDTRTCVACSTEKTSTVSCELTARPDSEMMVGTRNWCLAHTALSAWTTSAAYLQCVSVYVSGNVECAIVRVWEWDKEQEGND